jgi:hypothetical protein
MAAAPTNVTLTHNTWVAVATNLKTFRYFPAYSKDTK